MSCENSFQPFQCGICQMKFCHMLKFLHHFDLHQKQVKLSTEIHVCSLYDENSRTADGIECIDDDKSLKCEFKCTSCAQMFPTLCMLHKHLLNDSGNSSFYYDASLNACTPEEKTCLFSNIKHEASTDGFHSNAVDSALQIHSNVIIEEGKYTEKRNGDKQLCNIGRDRCKRSEAIVTEQEKTNQNNKKSTRLQKKQNTHCSNSSLASDFKKITYTKRNNPVRTRKENIYQINNEENAIAVNELISVTDCENVQDTCNKKEFDNAEISELLKHTQSALDSCIRANESKVKNNCEYTEKALNPSIQINKNKSSRLIKQQSLQNVDGSLEISFSCMSGKIAGKSRRGRPRKPDSELKHKRRNKLTVSVRKQARDNLSEITAENRNDRLSCVHCGKVILRYCMKNHTKVCTMDRPFKCDICQASFATKGTLIGHKKAVHLKINPYQCEICGDRFFVPSKLAKHKLMHTRERNYACSMCNKCFMHKEHLRRHEKLHSGIKDQICSTCGKMFFSTWNLKQHELTHKDSKFSCPACPRAFTTKRSLKKHQETGCNVAQTSDKRLTEPDAGLQYNEQVAPSLNNQLDDFTVLQNYVTQYSASQGTVPVMNV